MNSVLYNPDKLMTDRPLFHNRRVCVVGCGAVGSYLIEQLAKMGASPDAVDFDVLTLENAAKHGSLIRTPEDAGRNKAVCVSERVKPFLDQGCTSHGIDSDLCLLGPEAFADYDVVFAALDNFAAKVLLNELIRQLPPERRPLLIMDGTYGEMAQSVMLDNTEFCLRCLMDESWLKDSAVRTSCTSAPIRQNDGLAPIVRTSARASSLAAHLSTEQYRGYVTGAPGAMNRRLTYTAYPGLELRVSHPLPKRNCPGCAIQPPAHLRWLRGSVLTVSLREAMQQISEQLGTTDFELSVHRLHYKEVLHSCFIVTEYCRACGKPIRVLKHAGRTFPHHLLCLECNLHGKQPYLTSDLPRTLLYAFTPSCEDAIQDMTLFDLGYPLGAHIEVIERQGAFDLLDRDKIKTTFFALDEDHCQMRQIQKLSF